MENFSKRLRQARLSRSWSQQQLAEQVGTTAQNVSRWERGITVPDLFYQQRLCELFQLSSEEFGFWQKDKESESLPPENTSNEPLPTASPPPPRQEKMHHLSQQKHNWLIGTSIGVVIMICLSSLYVSMSTRHIAHNAQASNSSSTTTTQTTSSYPVTFSFEHGNDNWDAVGHVLSFSSSSDIAWNGSRSLKVIFSSRNQLDKPFVEGDLSQSDNVHAGQTINIYVYVPEQSVTIMAQVFTMDAHFQWYSDSESSIIPSHIWYQISYHIPAPFNGPATRVGVQFTSKPYNVNSTVYVDAVGWQ